jgi:hypothetical protein
MAKQAPDRQRINFMPHIKPRSFHHVASDTDLIATPMTQTAAGLQNGAFAQKKRLALPIIFGDDRRITLP